MKIAILRLYCGESGKSGFYNSQEIGLAKAYEGLGHDVFVIFPDKRLKRNNLQKKCGNITIIYISAKSLGVHAFFNLNILQKLQINLVQIGADNQLFAPWVMRYCKRYKIDFYNYVGTLKSDTEDCLKKSLTNFLALQNIYMYKKSKTFVKTEYVRKELENRGVENSVVIPVGLDFEIIPYITESREQIRKTLLLPVEKRILLFVGRLEVYKHPEDAIQLIMQLDKNYILVMIGNGAQYAKIQDMIERWHLKERVRQIPDIPNSAIHQYYRASDCLINLNKKEIFGMSILEAVCQGCPVIARHAPGPDTIIQEGITGYLCNNLEEMKERIINLDMSISEEARLQVRENFSWNNAAQIILNSLGYTGNLN